MKIRAGAGSAAQAIPGAQWLRSAMRNGKRKKIILLPSGIGRVLAFATDEHKLDGCQQSLQVDRLPNDFLRPHGPGFIEAFFIMTSGDNDHATCVLTLAELPEYLDAVHTGHEQIEKDQVGRRLLNHREGLGAVFDPERPIASETEKLNEQVADQQLIIDDKDRFPRIGHSCAASHRQCTNGFSRELYHSVDTFDQHIKRQTLSDKVGDTQSPRLIFLLLGRSAAQDDHRRMGDRKSTRLNSSHVASSYAVFCLKKKKHPHTRREKTSEKSRHLNHHPCDRDP